MFPFLLFVPFTKSPRLKLITDLCEVRIIILQSHEIEDNLFPYKFKMLSLLSGERAAFL